MACALIGSLGPPIFFLAVAHFKLEGETAEWLVSLWPRWAGSVALEDRRAAADLAIGYEEMGAASMLAYTLVVWGAVFVYARFRRSSSLSRRTLT